MNYIEQFLKDNNLEIGQKFRPKGSNVDIWFDENFEMQGTSAGCKVIFLTEIMTGKFEFEEELPKRWRAEKGGQYCFVETSGLVYDEKDDRNWSDDFKWESGNYFENGEQAKEYKKKLLVKQRYADMSDVTEEQMRDVEVENYYAYYDFYNDKVHIDYEQACISGVVSFTTEEKCLQAIKEIGEEDIKKYVLEV